MMFVVGDGIFEHVGVLFVKTYSYDQHRILMAGLIPLATLLIEASLVYAAMTLFKYLNMKPWMSIWVVGLLASFHDFSIDPVYVHGAYVFNGILSGQWNWVEHYSQRFFGIPFQNFTGWTYMTGLYAVLIYLGYFLAEKFHKQVLKQATPFIAGLFLMVPIVLFSPLINGNNQRIPELIKLLLAVAIGVILT